MSISTTPGRPDWAMAKARATTAGTSDALVTRKLCLVMEAVQPMTSDSWKASVPMARLETWPVTATKGTESA
jgi:hypothetical protein